MKKLRAQQLVEFLLVAPFIIIILGIMIEYAYALNVNMTLTHALKYATSHMYFNIKPNMSIEDIQAAVKTDLESYLEENNISISAQNKVDVKCINLGQNSVFSAYYTFIPAFTLPMQYFRFIPDKLDFFATASVPSTFLNSNNYGSSISISNLDSIWSVSNGVLTNPSDQSKILFLKKMSPTQYTTHDWSDATDGCVLNASVAKLSGAGCIYNGMSFSMYINVKGYQSIYFVSGAGAWSDVRNRTIAIANLSKDELGDFDATWNGMYKVALENGKTYVYMPSQDNLIGNLK